MQFQNHPHLETIIHFHFLAHVHHHARPTWLSFLKLFFSSFVFLRSLLHQKAAQPRPLDHINFEVATRTEPTQKTHCCHGVAYPSTASSQSHQFRHLKLGLSSTMHVSSRNLPSTSRGIIIIAFVITGIIVVIVAMLLMLCHATNKRRRKAQLEREGVEITLRGSEGDAQARNGVEGEEKTTRKASRA